MTRRYLIAGAVQSVGFRWFVARHARALGLGGFARNLADGSVEVVVSGSEVSALDRLEELLRAGPANARVTAIQREDRPDAHASRATFDVL